MGSLPASGAAGAARSAAGRVKTSERMGPRNVIKTRGRVRAALGFAAVAATVTGCSTLPGVTQQAPPPGEQLPPYLAGMRLDEDMTPARALAADRLLQLDPCAILDPTTAEQTLGQKGDSIVPGDEITSCGLDLIDPANPDNRTNINLAIEPFEQGYKADTAPVQLPGGVTVGRTAMPTSCIYEYDLGSGYAISVQVSVYGAAEGQPCSGGDKFLAGIAPSLANPPMRDQGLTTPTVRAVSPCVAIREAMSVIPPLSGNQNNDSDQRPQVSYEEPHKCAVEDWAPRNGSSTALPQTRVMVAMEVSQDPEQFVQSGVSQPITIEGRTGTVRQPDPADDQPMCEVAVRMGDDVMIRANEEDDDGEVRARVVQVEAPTCDQAAAVATSTLRAART